jgi:hypothetical protein
LLTPPDYELAAGDRDGAGIVVERAVADHHVEAVGDLRGRVVPLADEPDRDPRIGIPLLDTSSTLDAFGSSSSAPTSANALRCSARPTWPILPLGDDVPGQRVKAAEATGRALTFWYCEPGPKIDGEMAIVAALDAPVVSAVMVNVLAEVPKVRRVCGCTGRTFAIENLSPALNVSPVVQVSASVEMAAVPVCVDVTVTAPAQVPAVWR